MDHSVTKNINRDLAMRLRVENFEQFTTLVKMHLSFELDLHTEEYVNFSRCRSLTAYQATRSVFVTPFHLFV